MPATAARHNYPGRTPSVELSGDFTQSIENNIKRFTLTDDIRDWRAIPKKLVDVGLSGKKAIVVPSAPYDEEQYEWFEQFHRNLYLNVQNTTGGTAAGEKKHIPINRPSGHSAYIHNITWQPIDHNEPLPYVDFTDITAEVGSKSDMVISDSYTHDISGRTGDGLIIAIADDSSPTQIEDWIRSNTYTTAHYPDMAYSGVGTYAYDMFRQDNIKVIERLSERAPRSNALRGMIPTDWCMNNFAIAIGAHDGTGFVDETDLPLTPSYWLWDSMNRYNTTDDPDGLSFEPIATAGSDPNRGLGVDGLMPIISNQINKLIPASMNYLTVDVSGPGWFHYLELEGLPSSQKGTHDEANRWRTIVLMPVRVTIDILYRPTP